MPTIALTPIPAGEMKRAPLNVWAVDIQTAVNGLDGTNFLAGTLAADHIFRARVSGDSNPRVAIQSDGKFVWGSGAGVGDTNLYRSAADTLKTDDAFKSALAIMARDGVAAEQVNMGNMGPSGEAGFTFGTAADTNLYRSAANVLKTDDYFSSELGIQILNDAGTGVSGIRFGASADTNLYRSAADTLKTDDGIIGAGGLATLTKAGVPSDADVVAGMQVSGAMILDTTNSRIYFRVGSTWKYAALT